MSKNIKDVFNYANLSLRLGYSKNTIRPNGKVMKPASMDEPMKELYKFTNDWIKKHRRNLLGTNA